MDNICNISHIHYIIYTYTYICWAWGRSCGKCFSSSILRSNADGNAGNIGSAIEIATVCTVILLSTAVALRGRPGPTDPIRRPPPTDVTLWQPAELSTGVGSRIGRGIASRALDLAYGPRATFDGSGALNAPERLLQSIGTNSNEKDDMKTCRTMHGLGNIHKQYDCVAWAQIQWGIQQIEKNKSLRYDRQPLCFLIGCAPDLFLYGGYPELLFSLQINVLEIYKGIFSVLSDYVFFPHETTFQYFEYLTVVGSSTCISARG